MSRTLFRSKNIEPDRPVPIYSVRQLQDRADFSHVSRGLVSMPTGLEKEEETEAHLQAAMRAQAQFGETRDLVIPVPEFASVVPVTSARRFKPSRSYIRQDLDTDAHSRYDADSEDELFIKNMNRNSSNNELQNKLNEVDLESFEKLMEKLEFLHRGSPNDLENQTLASNLISSTTLSNDTIDAIFLYWKRKRANLPSHFSLIPQVKTEQNNGSKTHDPYVAFRKRFEKMQTRKNRKVEEANFEKLVASYLNLINIHKILFNTCIREDLNVKIQKKLKNLFNMRTEFDSDSKLLNNILSKNQLSNRNLSCLVGIGVQNFKIPQTTLENNEIYPSSIQVNSIRDSIWRTSFSSFSPYSSHQSHSSLISKNIQDKMLSMYLLFDKFDINSKTEKQPINLFGHGTNSSNKTSPSNDIQEPEIGPNTDITMTTKYKNIIKRMPDKILENTEDLTKPNEELTKNIEDVEMTIKNGNAISRNIENDIIMSVNNNAHIPIKDENLDKIKTEICVDDVDMRVDNHVEESVKGVDEIVDIKNRDTSRFSEKIISIDPNKSFVDSQDKKDILTRSNPTQFSPDLFQNITDSHTVINGTPKDQISSKLESF